MVDELKTSKRANEEIEKAFELQKGLVLEAKAVKRGDLNDVASVRERIAAASWRESDLCSNA